MQLHSLGVSLAPLPIEKLTSASLSALIRDSMSNAYACTRSGLDPTRDLRKNAESLRQVTSLVPAVWLTHIRTWWTRMALLRRRS